MDGSCGQLLPAPDGAQDMSRKSYRRLWDETDPYMADIFHTTLKMDSIDLAAFCRSDEFTNSVSAWGRIYDRINRFIVSSTMTMFDVLVLA